MPGRASSTTERESPLAKRWREVAAAHELMVHALMFEVGRLRARLGDDEGLGLMPCADSIAHAGGGVMAVVTDPKTRRQRVIESCRSCGADIYWSTTDAGKLCPFNVTNGEPTRESHFRTCPDAKSWTKKSEKSDASAQ